MSALSMRCLLLAVLAALCAVADAETFSRLGALSRRASAAHKHKLHHHRDEPEEDAKVAVDMGPVDGPDVSEEAAKLQKRREKVAALLWLEGRLRDLGRGLDEQVFQEKAEESERAAASQISMPETVNTLAEMRKEMHRFAAPVYQKAVEEELATVSARREALLKDILEDTPMKPLPEEPKTPALAAVSDEDATEAKAAQGQKETARRNRNTVMAIAVIGAAVAFAFFRHNQNQL